jgi:hypothetical protein
MHLPYHALNQPHHTPTNAPALPRPLPFQAAAPSDVARLKQHLKDTFSSFNAAVERIYNTQSGWTVPDSMLRDAVRRVIKSDMLPPYQDFLRKCVGARKLQAVGQRVADLAGAVRMHCCRGLGSHPVTTSSQPPIWLLQHWRLS